MQVIL